MLELFNNKQSNETEVLIKHLDKLREKAVKDQPADDLRKWYTYYSGVKGSNNRQNKYNIIKGIIDSKATLILDNEIVSTVVPRLKTFVDEKGLALQGDIADILKDINAFVLDNNNFDKIKSKIVLDELIYSVGFTETVWEQNEDEKLGDVRINALDPQNCFPDASAKTIQDCNFFFIKETYSPITLKKKYPEYAEKLQKSITSGKTKPETNKTPTGISTVKTDINTTQVYSYGTNETSQSNIENQKNIVVWKCYLKDDSTFLAKATEEDAQDGEAELMFKYPNGRLIMYVDGAKDYVLEDKPIDYPFGFPIDIYTSSTNSIWGQSEVSYLIELQDRINRAWEKIQYTVGSYHPFTLVDGNLGIEPADILNEAILKCDNLQDGGIQEFANDAISSVLNEFLAYVKDLKQNAYEISRINPMMISGERPSGITSGEQIAQLNQSPMLAIKEKQRHFKYFICEQCKKNIVLIQLYYNTPRIIRITNSKQVAELPATIDTNNNPNGLQQQPIRILEQKQTPDQGTYYEAIKVIQGDLSIGEYDVQVIAGTEMPQSRTERAQLTMQLAQMGYLGNDPVEKTNTVLTALDYPYRHQVIDKLIEEQNAASQAAPPEPPTDKISVAFKDLPSVAQGEWLQAHGFPQAAQILLNQQNQNLEHLTKVKELIKE